MYTYTLYIYVSKMNTCVSWQFLPVFLSYLYIPMHKFQLDKMKSKKLNLHRGGTSSGYQHVFFFKFTSKGSLKAFTLKGELTCFTR